MKILKFVACADNKEQLAQQLAFILEEVREGAITGSGYTENGPFMFAVKDEVFQMKDFRTQKQFLIEINMRADQTERLVEQLEAVMRGIQMGCSQRFGETPHGTWNYIIWDRVVDRAALAVQAFLAGEEGTFQPEDFLRDDSKPSPEWKGK